jgi:small subunit ribosomal protein S8
MASLNDPIADLLTRLRNASSARHRYVDLRLSKLKQSIIQVLQEQGFVDSFIVDEQAGRMRVFLKYTDNREPVIQGLQRISRPSLRRFIGYRDIPVVLGGMGIAILSTPQGVLDGAKARELKAGGEILCKVW